MITHIVQFQFKASLAPEKVQEVSQHPLRHLTNHTTASDD